AAAVFSSQMVLGVEFGSLMLQGGDRTRILLQLALVGTAVLPWFFWYRIQQLNRPRARMRSHDLIGLVLGFALGLWAASRVVAFNPSDPELLQVFRFDIWWTPMIAWLLFCFVGTSLALVQARSIALRIATFTSLIAPAAAFALHFQELI